MRKEDNWTLGHVKVTSLTSIPQALNEFEGLKATTCEGYLYIQTVGLWGLPTPLWKRKYCILKDDCVYFLKKQGEKLISDFTPHLKIECDTGIYPHELFRGKYKYCIRIVHDKQTHILYTKTESERNKWLSSLLTCITKKYITKFKSCAYETIRLPSKIKRKSIISRRHSSFDQEDNKPTSIFTEGRNRLYSDGAIDDRRIRETLSAQNLRESSNPLKRYFHRSSSQLKIIEETQCETENQSRHQSSFNKPEPNQQAPFNERRESSNIKRDLMRSKRRGSYSFGLFKTESMFDLRSKANEVTATFYTEL